jgi:hypothetical protein
VEVAALQPRDSPARSARHPRYGRGATLRRSQRSPCYVVQERLRSPHFATEAYAMRAATVDGTEDIAAACSGTETDIDNEPTSPRGSERRDCGATRPGRQSQPRVGGVQVVPRDSGPANCPRGVPVTECEPARASVSACVPGTRLDDRINPGVEHATGADGGSHALAAAAHWQRWTAKE